LFIEPLSVLLGVVVSVLDGVEVVDDGLVVVAELSVDDGIVVVEPAGLDLLVSEVLGEVLLGVLVDWSVVVEPLVLPEVCANASPMAAASAAMPAAMLRLFGNLLMNRFSCCRNDNAHER